MLCLVLLCSGLRHLTFIYCVLDAFAKQSLHVKQNIDDYPAIRILASRKRESERESAREKDQNIAFRCARGRRMNQDANQKKTN